MRSVLLPTDARYLRPSQPSHLDCLRPAGWELAGLALLLVYYLLSEEFFGPEIYATTNVVGPLWLTGVLALGIVRMARMNPDAMWTALFWFRLSTGVYFGLGSLVPVLANPAMRASMEAFFLFYSDDIAKVNVLVAASVLVVLATAYLFGPWLGGARPGGAMASEPRKPVTQSNLLPFGVAFYAIGAVVKYLVVLPYTLGLTQETLAGAVGTFSGLILVGIFLLSAWSFEYARRWLPLIIALLLFDMAIDLMTFAKSELMFALIMFCLGILRRGITKPRVAVATAALVLTYMLITPIASYGRQQIIDQHGARSAGVGLSQRAAIVASYFADDAAAVEETEINWAVMRISYINAATFAVRLYDTGVPSPSLDHLLATFIPRFLWPDKPIITRTGADFNFAATGNDQSQSGPGLFAEAYWTFGWAGVPILMIPFGVILSLISTFALNVFRHGKWIFFPIVFLGLKMGFRVDGFFVADIAGTVVFMIVLYAILALLDRLLVGTFRRPIST